VLSVLQLPGQLVHYFHLVGLEWLESSSMVLSFRNSKPTLHSNTKTVNSIPSG
jgi:hypothetical protein